MNRLRRWLRSLRRMVTPRWTDLSGEVWLVEDMTDWMVQYYHWWIRAGGLFDPREGKTWERRFARELRRRRLPELTGRHGDLVGGI